MTPEGKHRKTNENQGKTGKIQKHKLRTLALEEIPKNSIHVGSNGLRG